MSRAVLELIKEVLGMANNILYVVMHGLISLVDLVDRNQFIAYLLDMGEDHEYLFGNWLDEVEIPQRPNGKPPLDLSLTVQGTSLKTAFNQLDSTVNAVAPLKDAPKPEDPNVRAVFRLPRPLQIFYGGFGPLNQNSFTPGASTLLLQEPKQLCSIRIFQYNFNDPNEVFLLSTDTTRPWSCPVSNLLATINGQQQVAVLHIYNEPRMPLSTAAAKKHNLDEFNLSLKVMGVPLQLVQNPDPIIKLTSLLPGLYPDETTGLNRRSLALLTLTARVRSGNLNSMSDAGGTGGEVCSPGHGMAPS